MDKLTIGLFQLEFHEKPYFLDQRICLLDPRRFRILLIYAQEPRQRPDPPERLGMPCYFLKGESDAGRGKQLKALCQQESIDILHCNRHETIKIGMLASGYGRRPRLIANFHGMKNVRSLGRKLYYRLLHSRIAVFVGVTEAARDAIAANLPYVPADKVIAIRNSIDFDLYASVSGSRQALRQAMGLDSEFVYIAIGRLVERKRYGVLLEAFGRVAAEQPDCRLMILGDGRDRQKLEDLIGSRKDLAERVLMLGHRSDIPELLHASDAFVHAAIKEAFGLVVAEAMAAGLPAIVVDDGSGPTEIVSSTDYGYLAKPDDPEDLAKQMLAAMQQTTKQRRQLTEAATARVSQLYSHRAVAEELEQLYRTIATSA